MNKSNKKNKSDSEKKRPLKAHAEYLSTGEAASLYSVKRDTFLKWIKSGRIPAVRTMGGHYRVRRDLLDSLLDPYLKRAAIDMNINPVRFCWEHFSKGESVRDKCRHCFIYLTRSSRCYELKAADDNTGSAAKLCLDECNRCEYYRVVKDQKPNLLIVSDREVVPEFFLRNGKEKFFNIRFSDCEYNCSREIESFRPDYVIIDCHYHPERGRQLAHKLCDDSRIPFVKIMLVSDNTVFFKECDKVICARVEKPLTNIAIREFVAELSKQ